MTLASKKSLKTFDLGNVTPFGIGGPKDGTSLDLVTATLKEIKKESAECFTAMQIQQCLNTEKYISFFSLTPQSNFLFLSNMPIIIF